MKKMNFYIVYHTTYKCGEVKDIIPIAYESKKHILNMQKEQNEWRIKWYGEELANEIFESPYHIERTKVDFAWCEKHTPMIWVARRRMPMKLYEWHDYKNMVLKGGEA